MFGEYLDRESVKMDESIRFLESRDAGIMKTIATELSQRTKTSVSDSENKYDQFDAASKATRNRVLVSKPLADVSSWMEGSVILYYMSQKAGAIEYIVAELEHRQIEYYLDPAKDLDTLDPKELKRHNTGRWDKQSIAWLKKALKLAEYNRLCKEAEKTNTHPPKLDDIRNIKPLSEKLKEWMPKQWAIYKERKGQVPTTTDSN
jgi:hypothetical protein